MESLPRLELSKLKDRFKSLLVIRPPTRFVPMGREESRRLRPESPSPPAPTPEPREDELFAANMKDIYFDFDVWKIRSDQQSAIEQNAAFLAQHPNISFTVEGNCDERGSTEYNLALG
jgi:outer membrane protein OmpA-like peptidoglycan-associated protein